MASRKGMRWALVAVVLFVMLIAGGVVGFRLVLGVLKGKVVDALGPGSGITELKVSWSAVEVLGLRIKGMQGWPAPDSLRAERVVIVPSQLERQAPAVKTELRAVDLMAFQPYLSKASDTRIQRGVLDLDLASEVNRNRLWAPGRVTISDLQFAPAHGSLDTFMGLPRVGVVSFLRNKGKGSRVCRRGGQMHWRRPATTLRRAEEVGATPRRTRFPWPSSFSILPPVCTHEQGDGDGHVQNSRRRL
jgi:uncharacterized protein DUF748